MNIARSNYPSWDIMTGRTDGGQKKIIDGTRADALCLTPIDGQRNGYELGGFRDIGRGDAPLFIM